MDEITQEDIGPQTERELTSPSSSKPKTVCTVTNNHSEKSRFDFPELLTFQKTSSLPPSKSTPQNHMVKIYTTENWDIQDEKPCEQLQDTKLIAMPTVKVTTSHTDYTHARLSEVCYTAERHFLHVEKDEQYPFTKSDKLSLYRLDDAGGALADSHMSTDTSTDMSCNPDCKRLGKSLVDEDPGDYCLHAGNDQDGRQVQHYISQIQAFTISSCDEEVTCHSDHTYVNAPVDADFCKVWIQFAEFEASNQKREEHNCDKNNLFRKEEKEWNSPTSSSAYVDLKPFYTNPEENSSGSLTEDGKNEETILELQHFANENAAISDAETKGQANENGMSRNFVPFVAECVEGSFVSYDVVLARNISVENGSLETDDFCEALGEHAAGKMIAKAWIEMADHTTETPMSARIGEAPAEGDNVALPFNVIDPAMWSETEREAEEKSCNPESTAGVELSPSVQVCEMEMSLPLCSAVRPSQEVSAPSSTRQFNHQSRMQQGKEEKEDLCQPYTEPQTCSITTNETHDMIGSKGGSHWKSSPSRRLCRLEKPPPAGYRRQESYSIMGHQLNEQDQSSYFPVSLDNQKTQEAEHSQTETTRMDRTTEIKQTEEITNYEEEIRTEEHGSLEKTEESVEELLKLNEVSKEDTNETARSWTEGKISECGNRIIIKDQLEKKLEYFSDHVYMANISMMVETTEEEERNKVTNVGEEEMKPDRHENSEILKLEDDLQQHTKHKTDTMLESHVECISEWTDGNLSGNKLPQVSHQHRAETFMAESPDNILAFTFPLTSDAVVPYQHDLSHSQNANDNPTGLNRSDRFSPVPSAFTLYDRALGGFDTFEKIQLSLDDDDDDTAGPGNIPLLTSLPGQLLKTPQQQLSHSMLGAESDRHEETPEEEKEGEEEMERFKCHTDNMDNGDLDRETSCSELPNFISAADVIALGWPEPQTDCESACDFCENILNDMNTQSKSTTVSTKSDSAVSSVNDYPEFEMQKQFNMVLKELNLYFDISTSDCASDKASSPEQSSDITEPLEADSSNCKEHLSSPHLGCHRDTTTDDADEECRLEMCEGVPMDCCTAAGSCDGEQEVPLGSHMCPETSVKAAEKHREPQEMEQRRKLWSPSFMCLPFVEQQTHVLPEQPKRLEPLRTCTRPIRVGLSKRAKTKHLHCPHPYK